MNIHKALSSKQAARRGQGLVEYGILIGGVALVALAAISLFGHKVTDLIGTTAGALPAGHVEDAAPIVSGHLVNTTTNANGGLVLDTSNAANNTLSNNFGLTGTNNLIVEP